MPQSTNKKVLHVCQQPLIILPKPVFNKKYTVSIQTYTTQIKNSIFLV